MTETGFGRELAVRALGLYGPAVMAIGLGVGRRRREPKMGAAVLLGLLWMVPALLLLQIANQRAGWWEFWTAGPVLRGMPVELYLGWCVLWGALPVLLFGSLRVGWVVAAMVLADCVLMPLCEPVVRLGRCWLVGEAVAAGLVLLPGVLLARWTMEGRRVGWRAVMQVVTAAGVFLLVPPEVLFALRGGGWEAAVHGRGLGVMLQGIAVLALPGVAAVQEFAERGGGTPIPYDPPQRLVVSGVYRYVANPMQVSCVLVLLGWSGMLGSWWLAAGGVLAAAYSVGLARWDEAEDLEARFGEDWTQYRREVRDWRVRWRPYSGRGGAWLYVSKECGVCSPVGRWLRARRPLGLEIAVAEDYPGAALQRMRYEPGDGGEAEDGLRAMGRALEHLHLGWALVGAAVRLPGLWWILQVVADGVGFGPRKVSARGGLRGVRGA